MEEEEIYDDGITPVPSGLSALKSKFEKPTPAGKPTIGSKPALAPKSANIAAKFGGVSPASSKPSVSPIGPGRLKSTSGSTAKSEAVTAKTGDSSESDKANSGVPSLVKRNSKVNIPAAFQNAEAPPPIDKPKPEVKPVPKWKQKQDDTNNNKETVTNSNVSKDSAAMLNKDNKQADLPKKPIALPTSAGNVKDRANKLFGDKPPSEFKTSLKPVPTKTTENSKSITPKSIGVNNVNKMDVELRAKFGQQIKTKRKSVKSIVRSKDNKKFHKVDVQDIKSDNMTPPKPDKLGSEIDWDKLAADFKNLQIELESTDGTSGVTELLEEEEYDDIANVIRPNTRAISIIQPMTEDEEREWQENGFDGLMDPEDLPPPPPGTIPNKTTELLEPLEEYDDVGVLIQNGGDDGEELYEPLPDEPIDEPPPRPQKSSIVQNGTSEKPPPPPSTEQIEHKKDPKELERERKRKEKEEKELSKKKEKEFKKKQEDLKQLMSKYKIDAEGLTQSVGKGTVIKTMKGTKKDVAVQQGDKVDIIRMVDNDKGKWLIRILNTDKDDEYYSRRKPRRTVGYVDATNVEVDTDIIRDVMEGSNIKPTFSPSVSATSLPSSDGDDEGETYEAVDESSSGLIEDEIYEECN